MPKREYNIINELCNKTGIKHYLREKRTVIQHDLVNIHIVIPIYVALVTCGIELIAVGIKDAKVTVRLPGCLYYM